MTSDLDIYRTASVLIREHGEDAALEAAQRADAMLEKGSLDGQRVWKRDLTAVEEIQREDPREAALTPEAPKPEGRRIGRFRVINGGRQ